jgi:hypothetical protein
VAYDIGAGEFNITIAWREDGYWRGFETVFSDTISLLEPTHWQPVPGPPLVIEK